jgi:predicted small lipoprotein YifL
MRNRATIAVAVALLGLTACGRQSPPPAAQATESAAPQGYQHGGHHREAAAAWRASP